MRKMLKKIDTENFTKTDEIFSSNSNIFAGIKNRKAFPHVKFFKEKFLNNEVKYGPYLARDALTSYSRSAFFKPSGASGLELRSFFFHPRFKFGFVYNQKESINIKFVKKKIYRIEVYARYSKFLQEQKNNIFLHYLCRSDAFSLIADKSFYFGAQFSPLYLSPSAESSEHGGRGFFSNHTKSIVDFYYKKELSAANTRHGVYKGMFEQKSFFFGTDFFWTKHFYSLYLRKYFDWAMKKNRAKLSLLRKGFLEDRPKKRKKFIREILHHWAFFSRTKNIHYRNHLYTDRSRWRKGGTFDMRYTFMSKGYFRRKRRVVSSYVYKKAKRAVFDIFCAITKLKRSIAMNDRFRKKRNRRPFIRGAYKTTF